ncbi:DNA methyltransferase [Pseudomonas aeruginosa]|nr:site-specific DNA-methyltransferase [Pseudomonas aeruginosa]WOU27685.1 DNA methyltransferase [Pseudomonas aeruginosa]HBO7620155.1 site-specific DNA-methyltransferase [Pseudomonas aeruginosa]HBO7626231.1 site-specific DNA-methyltransferase [Pseudomonas aeruginosa]HBO7639713.1 site-specific DNA-methyltransferase [Pseudomonas aeruginosa]HBO7673484.1 site-specific DNA-methyltransferase [Pseudomonas aeruginosa]
MTRIAPGCIRDSIFDFLSTTESAPIKEIHKAVETRLGAVAQSSVRSYLNLNEPEVFERVERGRYRLAGRASPQIELLQDRPVFEHESASLVFSDCFDWLREQPSKSVHAVVTDPPYGLVEYTSAEQTKLRAGKGGVWRIPPAYDGHQRSPLPRFTTLTEGDRHVIYMFFLDLARHLARVTVPGANIVVASNPLLAHIVASAMSEGGLELRGYISRLVMTMRGGDRPKNAHEEFSGVSVMPRSMHEPWVVLRAPLEGRVQDNLRKWGTGGFRRLSEDRPFGDVIRSHPTPVTEKRIAPHPSLKPQGFLRQLVRASLPLGEGVVYDPFAGSGSTLAAANAVGYRSIGTERDADYFQLAKDAMPKLARLKVKDVDML